MHHGFRRAIDWTFRDRTTGAITVGQWPNLPLWLFLCLTALRWIFDPAGTPGTVLWGAATAALGWWAADEVLRGANPWRRMLGAAVLIWIIVSSAPMLVQG